MPKSKIKPSSTLIPVNSSALTHDESNVKFNIFKKQEIIAMILMLMKIFAMPVMKKTHQAMMRIQKMRGRLSSGCNVVNVGDGIT